MRRTAVVFIAVVVLIACAPAVREPAPASDPPPIAAGGEEDRAEPAREPAPDPAADALSAVAGDMEDGPDIREPGPDEVRPRAIVPGGPPPMHAEVRAAVRRVLAPIRECYARELAHDPSTTPRGNIRPVPQADGSVRFELAEPTGNARLDACLSRALRTMHVRPDPEGRPPSITYPFLFDADGSARIIQLDE